MIGLLAVCCFAFACVGSPLAVAAPQGVESRIRGGADVDIEQFPYLLSLQNGDRHVCGAVAISTTWALTSARCAFEDLRQLRLRGGSSIREEGGVVRDVAEIVLHPQWQSGSWNTWDFDFALLKVDTPFELSEGVKPATLPVQGEATTPTGASAQVVGWGATSDAGSLPSHLRGANVTVISLEVCSEGYYGGMITGRMLCAGNPDVSVCTGDAGGPQIVGGVVVGITSGGNGCVSESYPGVYGIIAGQRTWINEVTGV